MPSDAYFVPFFIATVIFAAFVIYDGYIDE